MQQMHSQYRWATACARTSIRKRRSVVKEKTHPASKISKTTSGNARAHTAASPRPHKSRKSNAKTKTVSKRKPKARRGRKLTAHQVQTIKYNKRVEAIAKLWKEQRQHSVTPPVPVQALRKAPAKGRRRR